MISDLLIIGAGPKAMAISAKATALRLCDYSVPDITIIEKTACAGNWDGSNGYTDGSLRLGTPPEKDVGYPYPTGFDNEVTGYMTNNFSWRAFLRSEEGKMRLSEWIDRGRPQPTHSTWATYLRWVNSNTYSSIVDAEVNKIEVYEDGEPKWCLTCTKDEDETVKKYGDALVITGPGKPKQINCETKYSGFFDGKTYWSKRKEFNKFSDNKSASVGVIGGGETAASIVVDLINTFAHTNPPAIFVFNTRGTIFSRGEGYFENRLFSDPEKERWKNLTLTDRKEIIERADRSVFSESALDTIDKATNIYHRSAEITDIYQKERYEDNYLYLHGEYGNKDKNMTFRVNSAINAIGFNPWSFVDIMETNIQKSLRDAQNQKDIEREVNRDLSIPSRFIPMKHGSPKPKLHVPMVAGLSQGPGFPNLSCLGRVADRILNEYVEEPRPQPISISEA